MNTHYYCVILAGGKGRRLWPCSREAAPKQFIDFFGAGRSQLQQTYDRFAKLLPKENIFVNTNRDYIGLVREQLPDLPPHHIMAEPVNRGTAPSVAWAAHRIARLDDEAALIVSPSDQLIGDDEAFRHDVLAGLDYVARHDRILTMGIRPTRPEPGYGYIQIGDEVAEDVCRVQSFTEKPSREFASLFVDSGEFYWNTGLFVAGATTLLQRFHELLPVVLRHFDKQCGAFSVEKEDTYVAEHFPSYPNVSMETGILEQSDNVDVMRCHFAWADLGTWHSLYEALPKTGEGNVVVDSDVMLDNCRGNVIKLPRGRLAVINGLNGFIVAEKDNVLFICKKEDSSALVRKYVNEVQIKKGSEFV